MFLNKTILFVCFGLCLFLSAFYSQSVFAIEIDGQSYTKQGLQTRVQQLLHSGNVELRRNVDLAFALAEIYEQEGNIEAAKELYDKALEVNPWNIKYQLRLANLLNGTARQQEAIEKARLVAQYAEDTLLIKDAEALLKSMGITIDQDNESIAVDENIEIILVPLGPVNTKVLKELQSSLKRLMGINFSIADVTKNIGKSDRDASKTFINHAFDNLFNMLLPAQRQFILAELNMDKDKLKSTQNKLKFIYAYLDKLPPEAAVKEKTVFNELLDNASQQKQYDVARLIKEMRQQFPIKSNSPIKGYLAITAQDIYEGSSNFRFGGAFKGYGVVSYHRFTAAFNKEDQNRPRLIKRTIKQAASSAFFILGIPRCSNPLCIRAYPHSLTELENKGDKICSSCLNKLRKFKNDSKQ